jgi:hypothetical protein
MNETSKRRKKVIYKLLKEVKNLKKYESNQLNANNVDPKKINIFVTIKNY